MVTPANQDQYNAKNAELIAAFEDLIKSAKNLVRLNGQRVGAAAGADTLSQIAIGDVGALQRALNIVAVAGRDTVGIGARLLREGAGGIEGTCQYLPSDQPVGAQRNGLWAISSSNYPPDFTKFSDAWSSVFLNKRTDETGSGFVHTIGNQIKFFRISNGLIGSAVEAYTTGNVTRDSNGVLRAASPIFRVATVAECAQGDGFKDAGAGMANAEAQGVTSERLDTGVYAITGSLGFATDNVWPNGFVIPQDANGNNLVFAEAEQDDEGTITLRTFEPKFDWQSGRHIAGEPLDIPRGRWVDMRLSMPKTEIEGGGGNSSSPESQTPS
ncbi:hypothetical protein [Vreelandella malpeensis]|uniref:Phage tail protein C-terminal domain-containing protein n=1 Tax=Vreelandella malpeensis TaxID=1172368 RepID=A0ABS8DV30_9GAMM|nr:hypothetical protein [Halomonas malpeensis]MCB8889918.1 hypothetical protein [Halomonas malpeensis]